MMENKTIIVIDDHDPNAILSGLQADVKGVGINLIYHYIKPVEQCFLNSDAEIDEKVLLEYIKKKIESQLIDMIAIDYDFGDSNLHGLIVANAIRQLRPNLHILMYSGNIRDMVKRALGNNFIVKKNELEIIDEVVTLVNTGISGVASRENLREKIKKTITKRDGKADILKYLITEYAKYPNLKLIPSFERCEGKTLLEISNGLQCGDAQIIDCVQEIIEKIVAHTIDICEEYV